MVGAAALQQREEDPLLAKEPLDLMLDVLERAATDAGNRELLRRATSIRAPRGFWSYPDPCRLIGERIGAATASTEIAEIGVLQTTILGRAARDIATGREQVVLITGAEARYRTRRCNKLGVEESFATQDESIEPDHVLRPAQDVLSNLEIERGLAWPVNQYSMIENALRFADGISIAEHRTQIAELWARFNAVAADNPDAWKREPVSVEAIRGDTGTKMLAFPYTVLHTSDWNVDQAAAFILTSTEIARELSIPEDRWVFPHAVVDSNLMLPLSERREIHRCTGFANAARRIEEKTGVAVSGASHLELYSCFPAAVRLQMREMGVPADRTPTVTGGMAYAGGPLNNFVLQALAKMAGILRKDPGSTGVVTAVSGMLTKQGVSLWSGRAPEVPFFFDDVSEQTAADSASVEVVGNATGEAEIVTYTILYPSPAGHLVALVQFDDGRRSIVSSNDPALTELASKEELCGRRTRVDRPDSMQLI